MKATLTMVIELKRCCSGVPMLGGKTAKECGTLHYRFHMMPLTHLLAVPVQVHERGQMLDVWSFTFVHCA